MDRRRAAWPRYTVDWLLGAKARACLPVNVNLKESPGADSATDHGVWLTGKLGQDLIAHQLKQLPGGVRHEIGAPHRDDPVSWGDPHLSAPLVIALTEEAADLRDKATQAHTAGQKAGRAVGVHERQERVSKPLNVTVDDLIEQDLGDAKLHPDRVPRDRTGAIGQLSVQRTQPITHALRCISTPLSGEVLGPVRQQRTTASPFEHLGLLMRPTRGRSEVRHVDPFSGSFMTAIEGWREQAHGVMVPGIAPSIQNLTAFSP